MRLSSGGNDDLHNRNLTGGKVIIPRTPVACGAGKFRKEQGIGMKPGTYTEYVLSDIPFLLALLPDCKRLKATWALSFNPALDYVRG
jgi:hypothetical protein